MIGGEWSYFCPEIVIFTEQDYDVMENKREEWFFSIADVVKALTDSTDEKQYLKKDEDARSVI